MEKVFSTDEMPWTDVRGLPGARGFKCKPLMDETYSTAFNCELIRLGHSDHSVPHVEPWSHLLYVMSGTGDMTIGEKVFPVSAGTVCLVQAGDKHALRNLGEGEMVILAIYDPPRTQRKK